MARPATGKVAQPIFLLQQQMRVHTTCILCKHTHFAHHCRCIKPNPESQPGNLTPNYVLEQLRAGGVLEAVRIACAGFPTRKAFRPFAIRYNILLASGRGAYRHLDPETLQIEEAADISRKVLQAVKIIGWQMGKTRVFLRAGQLAQLEVC